MLERARRRGDKQRIAELEEELACPDLPEAGAYLWDWYRELRRERDYAGMGDPLPLKSRDIMAWQALRHRRLAPWEVEVVCMLDAIERAALQGARAKEDG